ncbi:MAG: hypothetical protein ACLP19_05600 [Xanthobacteraceae bacterium]
MTKRGHFSKGVIETLMKRAGGLCSNPSCRRHTIGPSAAVPEKSDTVGVAAHIEGAQSGSARYDPEQADEERHGIDNGIWLCSFCATLIDKNLGVDFPVETLRTWKIFSEKSAREGLVRSAKSVKENCISTLIYINVPRLLHFDFLTQTHPSFPSIFQDGIPADRFVVPEMVALGRAIEALEFPALSWQETIKTMQNPIGTLVSFEGRFRTKNGPKSRSARESIQVDLTNLKTAPHIHTKDGSMKFILPYDPRFLTTNTAVVEFSSGQMKVGGFAIIRKITGDEVCATPLFIGLWSSPEARAFMNALRSHRPARHIDV